MLDTRVAVDDGMEKEVERDMEDVRFEETI